MNISDGLINLTLGENTELDIPFDTQYWLEITVGEGTPLSRIKLTSVPYALYSSKTSNIIEGEPLILNDCEGNMRMRLDPNTGKIEMFDDEEVEWYSIEVNSPAVTRRNNGDGTITVDWGNNSTVTYNSTKQQIISEFSTYFGEGTNMTYYVKYYNQVDNVN